MKLSRRCQPSLTEALCERRSSGHKGRVGPRNVIAFKARQGEKELRERERMRMRMIDLSDEDELTEPADFNRDEW